VAYFRDTQYVLTFSGLAVTSCTTRFNIQKLYVLSTLYTYVFYMHLRINGDFCTIQH
jgi:predicted GNAT superfamily acetyltransferase